MVREDDSEEIAGNIEGNLEEDMKSSASKEEDIPPEEEDNVIYRISFKDVMTKYNYIMSLFALCLSIRKVYACD